MMRKNSRISARSRSDPAVSTVAVAYHRAQLATLKARLREPPERIIALFGPRQTGKSTIARAALRPTDHYLAVDEPDPTGVGFMDADADNITVTPAQERGTRWLVRHWERARLDAERLPQGCVLMVDEVHKIPEWSETVKGLWDAGLIAGLQKYAGSAVRRRGSSPKLNVLNNALMTADSGYSFAAAQVDRTFWGHIVESAVGAHLVNTAAADIRVRYWRDGVREVDFVLQRGPKLVAIEVKSGPPRRSDTGALEAFANRFSRSATVRCLLAGSGGVPLNEFLTAPAATWFEEG